MQQLSRIAFLKSWRKSPNKHNGLESTSQFMTSRLRLDQKMARYEQAPYQELKMGVQIHPTTLAMLPNDF
jgi:hypothetical protein